MIDRAALMETNAREQTSRAQWQKDVWWKVVVHEPAAIEDCQTTLP